MNQLIETKPRELNSEFVQFCGTSEYYRYSLLFSKYVLTDGTKHVAESLGLYWFYDTILSYQLKPSIKNLEFQTWKLRKIEEGNNKGKWEVILVEGDTVLVRQLFNQILLNNDYEENFDVFTVFLSENVVFLPSEY